MPFGPLVDARWLRRHVEEEDVAVVDCRWRLGRPGEGERLHAAGHIPGAAFLDVDRDLAGPPGPRGRHPLPEPAAFEEAAAGAGIRAASRVVAYDDAGGGGAARLWWLLRHFGHPAAAVLDGGLEAWLGAGGELTTARPSAARGAPFRAERPADDVASAEDILHRRDLVVIDARSPERYRGEAEPVDPVAGRIPGARNLPFAVLAPGGRYLAPEAVRARLGAEGVTGATEIVAYCGSGITAPVVVLAADAAGLGVRLYPGSWSEWSGRGLPVETN